MAQSDDLYRPNWIHSVYGWLDRLPIPNWLTLALLVPLVGISQHVVAWSRGLLAQGAFNYDLATAGIYLSGLFFVLYVIQGSPRAIDEFRPLLDVSDEEYERLKHRFVKIPNLWGTIIFFIAAAGGLASGLADKAVAPAVDYSFAAMRLSIWTFGGGAVFVAIYQVVRQLRQIGRLYATPRAIDLYNQRPLYGFSRYTSTLSIIAFFVFGIQFADPTSLAATSPQLRIVYYLLFIVPVLLMFYLPLAGAHQRLVLEKQKLLQDVNTRIDIILARFHTAAFEDEDYSDVGGMRTVFSTLREEKETVESLSTWPWQPGTLNRVFSVLLLPVVLSVLREISTRYLGF